MLTRNLFYQLLVILIFVSVGCVSSQQIPDDGDAAMVDSIDNTENLLDSNLAYKKQFDSLSKEGDWLEVKKSDFLRDLSEETGEDLWESYPFGTEIIYIWRPFCGDQYWNPYTNGRWVFTWYGWSWISNYNWGWGPYNYGRWYFSNYYGWIWIPGRSWSSNWVSWRCQGNYIGWYPTCPVVYWTDYSHVRHTNRKFSFKPKNWQFVTKANFTKKIDKTTLISAGNNSDILKNAVKIKTSEYADPSMPRIKYTGPDVNDISKETREKIQPKKIDIKNSGKIQDVEDNKVSIYKKNEGVNNNNPEINNNTSKNNTNNEPVPVDKNTKTNTGTKKVKTGKNDGKKYKESNNGNDGVKNNGNNEGSSDKKSNEVKSSEPEKNNQESNSNDSQNSKTDKRK